MNNTRAVEVKTHAVLAWLSWFANAHSGSINSAANANFLLYEVMVCVLFYYLP
jgi:hypothetical protein